MTTITIKSKRAEAMSFIEYARSLPYVEVTEEPVVRFKPAVERSMKRSLQGKGLSKAYDNIEDMFKDLGI